MYKKTFILLIAIFIFLIYTYNQKIEIIYFYNNGCNLVNETNKIIEKAQNDFGNNIIVKKIDLFHPNKDEIHIIDKFNVKGVPTLIVNGNEYPYEYNYSSFKKYLCIKMLFIKAC